MIVEIIIAIMLLALLMFASFILGYFVGAYYSLKEDFDGRRNYD